MSSDLIPKVLNDTIAARWREQLAGRPLDQKRHWRTKTQYYAATHTVVESLGVASPTWWQIVDAVESGGHRSTFYEVAGPSAKHALLGAFKTDPGIDAMQIVLIYRRSSAVDQL